MSREHLIVLEAMASPDGVLELVTYRERDATWVGIAKKDKGLIGAIGLHTGSRDSVVEASASIDRGWGVAFGAVAPGIVRAEVRNDHDEAFAARIVALPDGFDPDYRAVWGSAERCRERCDLIAFDAEGRTYDQSDPRVLGPPPSDADRMEAIRAHADSSMRYYATAYLRESEENRPLLESDMSSTANFLALLEGAALDARSMLARREKIIQQFVQQAKTDPFEPGVCSFCGRRPVAVWFQGPDFPDVRPNLGGGHGDGGVARVRDMPDPCRRRRPGRTGPARSEASSAQPQRKRHPDGTEPSARGLLVPSPDEPAVRSELGLLS